MFNKSKHYESCFPDESLRTTLHVEKINTSQKVLPNGEAWRPQLLLLCYSLKILSEAMEYTPQNIRVPSSSVFLSLKYHSHICYQNSRKGIKLEASIEERASLFSWSLLARLCSDPPTQNIQCLPWILTWTT